VTDLELVDGVLAGRRQDFETLVERHQRMLYTVALSYLRDPDAADEAVQAAFVSAYTHLAQFRGGSVRSWLCRILLNACHADRRRTRRRREVALDDVDESALVDSGGAATAAAERATLERHVERLPARQRNVLSLRIFADLSFSEVAAAEGISENAAKVNYHHAIARLREWLGVRR
jgi:RNA polymerase sigma-70 factor, ECF subfamily